MLKNSMLQISKIMYKYARFRYKLKQLLTVSKLKYFLKTAVIQELDSVVVDSIYWSC